MAAGSWLGPCSYIFIGLGVMLYSLGIVLLQESIAAAI